MNEITSYLMFSNEFTHAPLGTTAAVLGIAPLVITVFIKFRNWIFKYKNGHNKILKDAGVPAFALNAFIMTIPLRNLPTTGWTEKIFTASFFILFLFSTLYLTPMLIQTAKTPLGSTLLVWKKSGESFYLSKTRATEATVFSQPSWSISVDDCSQTPVTSTKKYRLLSIEHKEVLCQSLTAKEGKDYIEKSIKRFKKDKIFICTIVPITMFILLWITLGFALNIHYSKKVRKYILTEQKKAIHYAHGEFRTKGIYKVYQELER